MDEYDASEGAHEINMDEHDKLIMIGLIHCGHTLTLTTQRTGSIKQVMWRQCRLKHACLWSSGLDSRF